MHGEKSTSNYKSAQDTSNQNYINPTGRFEGTVIRDDNGVITGLVFTQQFKYYADNYYGLLAYMVGVRPLFRGFFVFIFLVIVFTFLFTVLPNKHLKFYSQLPGGFICAISWYLFSLFLAFYVRIFNTYSMYGALATLMIFMFWLYFCMYFMLMAAEANVFFQDGFVSAWNKFRGFFTRKHRGKVD